MDEWCDSGLDSLGPDSVPAGELALGSWGLSWVSLVFSSISEEGDLALHLVVIQQHEPFLDLLLGLWPNSPAPGSRAREASRVQKSYVAGTRVHMMGPHRAAPALPHRSSSAHLVRRGAAHACLSQGLTTPHQMPQLPCTWDLLREVESEEGWKLQLWSENSEGHAPLHTPSSSKMQRWSSCSQEVELTSTNQNPREAGAPCPRQWRPKQLTGGRFS